MSWRIIIVTLLLAIAASIWGGLQLGNWLIANGPLKSDVLDAYKDLYTVPTLDADGNPYVPAPPQPLVDGRLAVPDTPEPAEWEINHNIDLLAERPPIALATASGASTGTNDFARQHVSPSGLQGLAQIGTLTPHTMRTSEPNNDVIQPIDIGTPPPPPSQEVQAPSLPITANPNWQVDFQRELQACDRLGFTKVPSCKWDARNKYCGPHNAWGRVPGCPAKAF